LFSFISTTFSVSFLEAIDFLPLVFVLISEASGACFSALEATDRLPLDVLVSCFSDGTVSDSTVTDFFPLTVLLVLSLSF
jgi:hypothetical protein